MRPTRGWPWPCRGWSALLQARSSMNNKSSLCLLAVAACPLVIGCSGAGTVETGPVGKATSALRRMQSCEELTDSLRADARVKMTQRIDAEIRDVRAGDTSDG